MMSEDRSGPTARLDWLADGARLFARALPLDEVSGLAGSLAPHADGRPGQRLQASGRLVEITGPSGPLGRIAAGLLGTDARPVRAVLFDKTRDANWIVAWHQDRTIAVAERGHVPGFGPWSMKAGVVHVSPPIEVLERMATLRLHLDPCGPDSAPLVIARGSHRLGKIAAPDAQARAEALPHEACLAEPGDVWAYSTPILHMSAPMRAEGRRRVLQVDFAAFDLPAPLKWRGLA